MGTLTRRILITGAGGFTGQHACRHFAAAGMQVTAALRKKGVNPAGCSAVFGDLTKRDDVKRMVEESEPDWVLHVAGHNSVAASWLDPASFLETNLMSTIYLLDALRNHSRCRVLIAGSMLNFALTDPPIPQHPYSLSKTLQVLASRSWGALFGQQILIAQPSNLIGPGRSTGICGLLARKIAKVERGEDHQPFRLSSFVEERDYLDVRDAVTAYSYLLEKGESGQVYALGSGRNRSLGDIVHAFQAMTECDLPLEAGQIPGYVPPPPVPITAIKAFGWEPKISFEQSLADTLQYYRNEV
ncbi:NAD(P)-dependent oxidoreductase [Paenibacillus alkaliterrae]|uniref:NAD-dependent epimerase/dehydratase family protein n=1 Tax=Paenibacillus alkaliterrae TaxID=320909 RepID=UPI001F20234B|nr:NAD(P)-dependent oxidoreductase [Paenibacillus alkaliterrae]MCF2940387.1 NAD(P)-dependent oxidoreductase [Paenibacillus alkaliterrae]